MAVLWSSPRPVTVGEVRESLAGAGPVAYTTVITVVERLRGKGWVERRRDGRSYRYSATSGEEEYAAHLMNQVLDDARDRQAALLNFAGTLDEAEARELREALLRAVPSPGDGRGASS